MDTPRPPPTSPDPARPGPARPGERIAALDALRGIALLGILLVNALEFSGPFHQAGPLAAWEGPLDRGLAAAVVLLCEGAFYTAFSLLYGYGLGLQSARMEARGGARGEDAGALLARRQLGLLAIGLLHAVLVWNGDILTDYAVVGLLLLAWRRAPTAELVRRGVALLAVYALLWAALGAAAPPTDPGAVAAARVEAVREATWAGMTLERLEERLLGFAALPLLAPGLLGLFCLGLAASRVEAARGGPAARAALRRAARVALPLGVLGKAGYAALLAAGEGVRGQLAVSFALAGPALGIGYASLALPRLAGAAPRLLAPFAAVGRMALTNYLAQSVVMTLAFYGYGLGLYGAGPSLGLPLALALYALQIAASAAWLRRFRYGPAEAAWRSWTYGRPVRLRR